MTNLFKRSVFFNAALGMGLSLSAMSLSAQENNTANAAPAVPVGPVICPGYKKGKTNLPGQSVGKKVAEAFEAYNEDRINDAVEILDELSPKNEFDAAYVKRFLGNILAGVEGEGQRALGHLKEAASPKILNDSEHASLLKLIGDLSMQEQEYTSAIDYYAKWDEFTCKEDPNVYTRIANANYQLKKFAEIVEPANKAIALFEKPNKNPYVLKLQAFYERKMYEDAVLVAEDLVTVFPEDPNWWTQLGAFYLSTEDYDRALSTYEIAYNAGFLKKKSQIQTLSQLYGAVGIPSKSAEVLVKNMSSGLIEKDEQTLSRVANAYHQAREYINAANYYGQAAKVENNVELNKKQGDLLLIAEDYSGAIKAYKTALNGGSEDVGELHYALMEANFHKGDFKQAFVHVTEAQKHKEVRKNARAWVSYIETKAKNKGIRL